MGDKHVSSPIGLKQAEGRVNMDAQQYSITTST